MSTKSETKKAKKAKVKELITKRFKVAMKLASLTEKEKKLKAEIRELMEELDEDKVTDENGNGFNLQRPETVVYHDEVIREEIEDDLPEEVVNEIWETKVIFNKKAFEKAIETGVIPDVDEILTNEEMVEVKDMTPRMMPIKSKKK